MTNLKLWRQLQNFSQTEAASRLQLGLSVYQYLESGRLKASAEQTAKLRRLFGPKAETILDEIKPDVVGATRSAKVS